MTDSEKLILLADWFDAEQQTGRWGDNPGIEVQLDLREMAMKLDKFGGHIPDSQQAV